MTAESFRFSYDDQKDISGLSTEELIQEGDIFKDANNAYKAIRYYVKAMEVKTPDVIRSVLPRLTSCYRAQGQPEKAIEECYHKNGSLARVVTLHLQMCARTQNGIPQCRCRWQMKALRDYCSGRRIGGAA